MGGYNSGRKASDQPCIDDLLPVDVCSLYRKGALDEGTTMGIRFAGGFVVRVSSDSAIDGHQRLFLRYQATCKGELKWVQQTVGIEWRPVLSGKVNRPYFVCPYTSKLATKLYLGNRGFAHRCTFPYLYRTQRLGHFDRGVHTMQRLKSRLSDSGQDAATDQPFRPKGMHQKTYQRYLRQHAKAAMPVLEKLGSWVLE